MSHRQNNFWVSIHSLSCTRSCLIPRGESPMIESCQILIFFPFLGTQVRWGLKWGIVFWQRVKIGEPLFSKHGRSIHISLGPLNYFFHNVVLLHAGFPVTIFQSNFAPSARFCTWSFLKLRPPSRIGLEIFSQLMRCNFLPDYFPPSQRKRLNIVSIFWIIETRVRSKELW